MLKKRKESESNGVESTVVGFLLTGGKETRREKRSRGYARTRVGC